uniref:Uncharacterized protein n=1 Tax=Brassica campestris TaxID=3711 RepID=A0A3P6AJJ8_BRACM|nr:unnamed protein product [Brassica rapa]
MWCTKKTSEDLRQHDLKALIPLKQYSYAQVKVITKSFVERVGKGGFGTELLEVWSTCTMAAKQGLYILT